MWPEREVSGASLAGCGCGGETQVFVLRRSPPPFALPHPRGPGGVECLVLPQKEEEEEGGRDSG